MRLIEEIYYGNLNVNGKTHSDKHYQKAMQTLVTNEEVLTEKLSGQEKKLFLAYADAWSVVNGTDTVENFSLGFKLGARLTAETLGDDLQQCLED